MSRGYSRDPRAYGLPVEEWDQSATGRALLADIDHANTPGRDGWAPADFVGTAPERLARAYRAAADTALRDPHFPADERQRRHDYYAAEAARMEKQA